MAIPVSYEKAPTPKPFDFDLPNAIGAEMTPQVIGEAARSSQATLELPTGYLDEQGRLHRAIVIREMDGRDEDLLANQKIPVGARLSRMIENCILSIGSHRQQDAGWSDIVQSLPVIDRLWILLQLRILTVGPIFSAKIQCPAEGCQRYSLQNVDLNDLPVHGISEPEKRTYGGKLPKSGRDFVCRVMTGADESRLTKMAQKNPEDLVSIAIASRLVSLDAKSPVSIPDVKSLSLVDRQHLRNLFKKHEGEIDRDMECSCPHCGTEFRQEIDFDSPNFFFPSET